MNLLLKLNQAAQSVGFPYEIAQIVNQTEDDQGNPVFDVVTVEDTNVTISIPKELMQ